MSSHLHPVEAMTQVLAERTGSVVVRGRQHAQPIERDKLPMVRFDPGGTDQHGNCRDPVDVSASTVQRNIS